MSTSNYVYKRNEVIPSSKPSSGEYTYSRSIGSNSSSSSSSVVPFNQEAGTLTVPNSSISGQVREYSISHHSSTLVQSSISSGALCPKEDLEMLEKVKKTADSALTDVMQRRKGINDEIDKFSKRMNPLIDGVIQYALRLITEEIQLTQATQGRLDFLIDKSKEMQALVFTTSEQYIKLQSLSSTGALAEYKGVIDLVFHARIKEVELLGQRLEILRTHENHELKIFTALHELQLKDEAQRFDQMIKLAEMTSAEREKEFTRIMTERKQSHAEKIDVKKLELDKYKIDIDKDIAYYQTQNQRELEEYRVKVNAEVEKDRTKANAAVERDRIEADSRARMAEAAASASKCSIM